jgi:hypothetical protein
MNTHSHFTSGVATGGWSWSHRHVPIGHSGRRQIRQTQFD